MRRLWFLLGVIVAITIMALAAYMASEMRDGQGIKIQSIELTHQIYLPVIFKNPTLHRMSDNTGTCEDISGSSQYYNWSVYNSGCSIPYVPMIWSINNLHDTWQVNEAKKYNIVLGFNEPNIDNPSAGHYMSMNDLTAAWKEMDETFPDHQISSPAMCPRHSCPYLDYYLIDFVDAYHDRYNVYPRFDIIALHFYGTDAKGTPNDNAIAFITYIDDIRYQLSVRGYVDIKLWVTEFGYWSYASDRYSRGREFLLACVGNIRSKVRFISWFGVRPGDFPDYVVTLRDGNGVLTSVGEAWNQW